MKNSKSKTLIFAFKKSLPVLFGYLFLGTASGLLFEQIGYKYLWSGFIALCVYAGSGQFLLAEMMGARSSLWDIAIMTIFLNSRHIFYGVSFIEKFKKAGWRCPFLIFGLTDETYGVNISFDTTPEGVSEKNARFLISVFNHSYWIVGCIFGALAGELIKLDLAGVDFSMTALFVIIFIDQIRQAKTKAPQLVGALCGIICLVVFGPSNFILPALISTVAILLLLKPRLEAKIGGEG